MSSSSARPRPRPQSPSEVRPRAAGGVGPVARPGSRRRAESLSAIAPGWSAANCRGGPTFVSGGIGRIAADRLVEVGDGAAGVAGRHVGVGPRPEGGPVVRSVAESGGQAVDLAAKVGSGDDDARGRVCLLHRRHGGRPLHRHADDLSPPPRQREAAGREPEAIFPPGKFEVVFSGMKIDPAARGGVDDRHQLAAPLDLDPDPGVGRLDDELALIGEDADDLRAERGPRPGEPQDDQEGQADRRLARRNVAAGLGARSRASIASTTARADPGRAEGSRASSDVMSAEAAGGSPGLSFSGGSGVATASAVRTASVSGPSKGTRPVVM